MAARNNAHTHIIFTSSPKSRRDCMGGTGVSSLLGLNKWTSRDQLKDYYLGVTDGPKQNKFMEWGLRIESPVADKYADFNNESLMDPVEEADKDLLPGHMVIHPDHHFLIGSPDRLVRENGRYKVENHKLGLQVMGIKHGLEIKTSYYFSVKKWEKEGIPEQYKIQCQFYMMLTGLTKWDLAVLHMGSADYVQYTLEADPLLHAEMLKVSLEFWEEIQHEKEKRRKQSE